MSENDIEIVIAQQNHEARQRESLRCSIYKLECGLNNIPIVSCCVVNRYFETTSDMLNSIAGTMNGLEKVFNHGSIFLCCINESKLILVQNGTIIASTPQL